MSDKYRLAVGCSWYLVNLVAESGSILADN